MASSHASPIDLVDDEDTRAPTTPPRVVPNVLAAMITKPTPDVTVPEPKVIRDKCKRLKPTYNDSYNPYNPYNESLKADYSPYDFGEPLFDDRKPFPRRFPRGMVLASALKKARTL
ncbi:hypothetical protein ACEPPN_001152 [Leptodophora sp. 'Broadleaf-Isolate-01']